MDGQFLSTKCTVKKKEVEIRSPTDICKMRRCFNIFCLHTDNISRAVKPLTPLLFVTDAQLISLVHDLLKIYPRNSSFSKRRDFYYDV
jgi:hypothetical protein